MPHLRLLLPAFETVAREARGPLLSWLARGDRLPDEKRGRAAALSRTFGLTPKLPLAAAAISRELLARDARGALWLRADPGHARADLASLRLLRCGDLGLTRDEAEELLPLLRPLFGDAGFELSAPHPDRWFLRGIASSEASEAEDPADILGDDLHEHLPQNAKWRRLLSEAQISLHNHPVNTARAERGELPVNTLWFWGAGKLPDRVDAPFARCTGTDELVVAYARAAGLKTQSSLAESVQGEAGALIECWSRATWNALLASLELLQDGLQRRRYATIEIECWTGECFTYRRAHRWRVFRPRTIPAH